MFFSIVSLLCSSGSTTFVQGSSLIYILSLLLCGWAATKVPVGSCHPGTP
jgi:hypothetical protein